MSREEEILDLLYGHTLDGEDEPVVELTNEGLALGMDPMTILFDALIPSLEEVGDLFEQGEYFVPEMLVAANAMAGAMKILKPLIAETGAKPIGNFVMGTVKGDIHDIGKNLCNVMLEGAGFEVIDIGVNVAPETLYRGHRHPSARRRGHERLPDHDHAHVQGHHRRYCRSRAARQGEDSDRRRAHQPGLCRSGGGRRLCARCQLDGALNQKSDRVLS